MAVKNQNNFLNPQEKLKASVKSAKAKESNLNQNHNTKKESLGPNTNR